MLEQQIKNSILFNLKIGTIQPFQIEEQLRMKGIPSFDTQRLKNEIYEIYQKQHPCF